MSRNFFAHAILVLDADAVGVDHDGDPYTNTDFPKNTVLCIDHSRFLYVQTSPNIPQAEARDPLCWPCRVREGIPLWRDYWRFVLDLNEKQDSPYHRAIVNAPKTEVVPPLNDTAVAMLKRHDPNDFWS